jgi:(p)ppGpp synthase/HD superfamily hydrolase
MANLPITPREQLAWDFAKAAHVGQVRKFSGLSYFDAHVQKVNGTVKLYTTDEDLLIAALLHDVPEDCFDNIWDGYAEIKRIFGKKVADLVMELTSNEDEIKHKYEASKKDYLVYKLTHMSDDALIIKLCDRLKNIEDAFTASSIFRKNYFNETVALMNAVESGRSLNRIQKLLVGEINSKLDNISSIFKIQRVNEIQ